MPDVQVSYFLQLLSAIPAVVSSFFVKAFTLSLHRDSSGTQRKDRPGRQLRQPGQKTQVLGATAGAEPGDSSRQQYETEGGAVSRSSCLSTSAELTTLL